MINSIVRFNSSGVMGSHSRRCKRRSYPTMFDLPEDICDYGPTIPPQGDSNAPSDRSNSSVVVCFCGVRLQSVLVKSKSADGSLEGNRNRRSECAADHESAARSVHL